MLNLTGIRVEHVKYKQGIIISTSENYVTVKFDNEASSKVFVYPDCFEKYLTVLDSQISDEIRRLLTEKSATKENIVEKNDKIQSSSVLTGQTGVFSSVDAFCDTFKAAINKEIDVLLSNKEKRYNGFDALLIEYSGSGYIYSFETDIEHFFPNGTQITIWYKERSIQANVISCEDFHIIISTPVYFGQKADMLEFSAEPWQLLVALNNRLDDVKTNGSTIVRSIISVGFKEINRKEKILTGQELACELSITQPITFIWGPPGTGKTHTLAKTVLEHMKKNNTILMLSHSNVAVDGAILRVYELGSNTLKPGKILRYGYPRDKSLKDHSFLTSFKYVLYKHPNLLNELEKLIEEKHELRTLIKRQEKKARQFEDRSEGAEVSLYKKRYIQVEERIARIRDELSAEEKKAVENAQLVATTASMAAINKLIYGKKYDVVIFDEASMAYIPQIVFAASLARKHFVCLGDFNQLPPISKSNNPSLCKDIFQYCGITYAVDNGYKHNWLCLLDIQYRMHPRISGFISKNMYHGLIKTDISAYENRKEIVSAEPFTSHPLAIADLSGMMSVCNKRKDNSRYNVLSAFISCNLALKAACKYEIGIVTPYNAQSRLISAMIKDLEEQIKDIKHITCATVHQFQGSEKDIIIYDAVDCYRMNHPGVMLTKIANNYANRLFNVAVTRAKGKFITVVNKDYMKRKKLSERLLFENLLSDNEVINLNGEELYDADHDIFSCFPFQSKDEAENLFLTDLSSAKTEILMDVPGEINASEKFINNICKIIEKAKQDKLRLILRTEQKEALPLQLQELNFINEFAVNPIAIIDKKIIWFGMPVPDNCFITEGKPIATIYRPIIRFTGTATARFLYCNI
jgi:hypothetical protein